MTRSFSNRMIISLSLRNIKLSNLLRILGHKTNPRLPHNHLPSLNRIIPHSFRHIISVQTHSRQHKSMKLLFDLFLVLYQSIVGSSGLGRRISHLAPIISKPICSNRDQTLSQIDENLLVLFGQRDFVD